ncbi:MAG: hypothetical protein K5873_06895 [Treponema sp.]|nr:hypothetical protein [Treponema sp.]
MKKITKLAALLASTVLFFGLPLISCSDSDDGDDSSGQTPNAAENNSSAGDGTNGFTLSETSIEFTEISLAASKTLKALNDGTEVTAEWSIDSNYVASVDSASGKVTPLTGGTATVTAKYNDKTATCKVSIPEPNREVTTDPFDAKNVSGDIEIICCGDSIMKDYAASDADQYGMGQALDVFFNDKANVVTNISNGGRSTRLFYNEEVMWPKVKTMLEANKAANKPTFVIFSFGHNDQREYDDVNATYGAQFTWASENENGTVAGTHYDFMERYIVETRALGAVPVCVTPFVRANYSGSEVSAYGKHDWSDKTGKKDSKPRGNYPAAMKAAAEKHGAILVDLTELSAVKVAEYNAAGKEKFFYVDSDSTHERTLGGLEIGRLITDSLKEQGYLASYINDVQPRVMVNKKALAFGRLLTTATKTESFKLSSFANTSGAVTITAPDCYSLSLEESGEYTSTLTIDTGADFIGTTVFVKFAPTGIAEYNGALSITHTSVTPDFGNTPEGTIEGNALKIALTGAGKEKKTGGSAFDASWLTDTAKYVERPSCSFEDIAPANVSLTGLDYNSFKNGACRFLITGGTWPVNDTGVKRDTEYLQFAIPAQGFELTVNKISFAAGSGGGSTMRWSAYYSTSADFANPTPLGEILGSGQTKDTVATFSYGGEASDDAALGVPVEDGQTFYLRIYPSHMATSEKTGKTFMLRDVVVSGLAN